MAFERLQALGEERFRKILNRLMRGDAALALAREIQLQPPNGWGEFQDVAEKTLTQQLNRLRQAAAEGMFGKNLSKAIIDGNPAQIKALEKVSVDVLGRLEELCEIQRTRVTGLVEKEKNMPLPIGAMLTATNAVFNDYKDLLLSVQKVRFDLGLDKFEGPVTQTSRFGGIAQSTTMPDGTNVQRQVFEAVTVVEGIFQERKIPKVVSQSKE